NTVGRRGLERVINGTDRLLIAPRFRNIGESYEPEVWRHLMRNVRTGDKIADVGAYIGLYTVALAGRVGAVGKVTAFEPDSTNFRSLKEHTILNKVTDRVHVKNAAVGGVDGLVSFSSARDIQNQIVPAGTKNSRTVPIVRL